MAGGGEARHVEADLGHDDAGRELADAGDGAQQRDGLAKGLEAVAHLRVDGGDGGVDGVDLAEMEAQQQALVGGHPAAQGRDQLGPRGADPGADPARQRSGSLSPAASASRMARPLSPMMSESTEPSLRLAACSGLVDALDVTGLLADQLLAGAGQVAQRLHRRRRHEAGADQAVGQQVGQPHGVVHVGLAAGHVLDLRRVGQHQIERFGEHRPDRLPVDAGGLHGGVGDAVPGQPVRQPLQLRGRRAEGLDVLVGAAGVRQPRAGDDAVAVNVQPRATGMQKLHDRLPPSQRRRRGALDIEL